MNSPDVDDPSDRPTIKLPISPLAATQQQHPPAGERTPAGIEASVLVISHPTSRMLGSRFRLPPGGELLVGRSPDADISLPEIGSISRHHARLAHDGSQVRLEDLGSTNGTLVNDQPLVGATSLLESGDRFQVGDVLFKLLHERDPESAYHEAILQLVATDGLTAILNRRSYDEAVERELARARRHGRPLSLVLFDVDRFKSLNDELGHLAGDSILMEIAGLVGRLVRREDVFARVGGEEFAVLCPETDETDAVRAAERIRSGIEECPFRHEETRVAVTCSFGVVTLADGIGDAKALYDAADRALYAAKRGGRNRVVRYHEGM